MKKRSLTYFLFCTLLTLLSPSDVLSDIVVTLTPSGNDTRVRVVGNLDVTGIQTSLFSTSGDTVLFSDNVSSILGETTGQTAYPYERGLLQTFGVAPNIGPVNVDGITAGFTVRYFAREIGAQGPLPSFVIVPQEFVTASGSDVSETILDQTFSSLNLTVGDLWGVEIPIFAEDGIATGQTQSLIFRAVPEPSSFGFLLCTGMFGLASRRRQKT